MKLRNLHLHRIALDDVIVTNSQVDFGLYHKFDCSSFDAGSIFVYGSK